MSLVTGKRSSEYKYIYELPYTERKCLCNILDINDQWERLGGEKMGFSVLELSEMRRAERCGDSPTDRLLQHWGRKNNTILNLYFLLYSIEHFQAMNVLLPFIPKEYHYEKLEEEFSLSFNPKLKKEKNDSVEVPKPSLALLADLRPKSETKLAFPSKTRPSPTVFKTDSLLPSSREENHNFCSGSASTETKLKVPQHLLTAQAKERSVPTSPEQRINSEKILNTAIPSEENTFTSQEDNIEANNRHDNDTLKTFSSKVKPKEEEKGRGPPPQVLPSRKRNQSNCSDVSNFSDCAVPMISYKELEEATSVWSKALLLGSGGFGSVFKGTWINVNVAIKRINQSQKENPNSSSLHINQVMDELRFLQKYRHDNILQVYGFSADQEKPHCLVYQFMSNGSLEYRLQCKKIEAVSESIPSPLTWHQRFTIAKGTAAALQFLHTVQMKPLIHGDVKSANILLDDYLQPKLGDFGLAREGPHSEYTSMKVSHVHGTRPYIPEEYLRSKKLSTKVDTYSFGIVLFEICSGKRAYSDRTKKYLKDEVMELTDRASHKDPKAGHDFARVFDLLFDIGLECIRREAKRRPDMTTVFQDLESCSKALKEEEEKHRKLSMEDYSLALSSHTPPLTFSSISTSPSVYSPHPPHSPHPFIHPPRMINPHLLAYPPSPPHPYPSHHPYRYHVVPAISPVSPISGVPLSNWLKGAPVSHQESTPVFTPTPNPDSERSSQGFCPPRPLRPFQVMRERPHEPNTYIPDINRIRERTPDPTSPPDINRQRVSINPQSPVSSIPDMSRLRNMDPTPATALSPIPDISLLKNVDPTPAPPPIPDISRLMLNSTSELPESHSSDSSSSSSSESEPDLEISESQSKSFPGDHEGLRNSNLVATEVCVPLLSQLGTSSRDKGPSVRPKSKTVSAQGKSTLFD